MEGYSNQPIPKEAAKKLLALDLEDKEILTYEKLDQWYTAWGGKCYVSFSGGKDSTVLAYLAARYLSSFRTPPYPLTLVFVNTGLEYPEIQKFVNEYADWLRREFPRITVELVRLRPKMNIRQVVRKYGYSIVSKEVAGAVYEARKNPNCIRAKKLRGELLDKDGNLSAYNCENWAFLLDAPFPISDRCCHVMKKASAHRYEGKTKEKPIVKYGQLGENWREMLHDGFRECMRVLKPDGVLIFKWAETQIPAADVWAAVGERPLFGHHSGKKSQTFWGCFMKFEDANEAHRYFTAEADINGKRLRESFKF